MVSDMEGFCDEEMLDVLQSSFIQTGGRSSAFIMLTFKGPVCKIDWHFMGKKLNACSVKATLRCFSAYSDTFKTPNANVMSFLSQL